MWKDLGDRATRMTDGLVKTVIGGLIMGGILVCFPQVLHHGAQPKPVPV
ncbi:MAG: hypothetical protein KKF77_07490 [Proteobacteria bacterium]|nr:hypothetical protein [Pseudomonadota bacterium]